MSRLPPSQDLRGVLFGLEKSMKVLLLIVAWCLLFAVAWPLALLALLVWPLIWLLSLPFRAVGIALDGVFALLRAVLFLPARVLGYRDLQAR